MRLLAFFLFVFACGGKPDMTMTMGKMAAQGTVGAACTDNTACTQTSATCVAPGTASSWPGGYCTVTACDTTTCPDGSFCHLGHMGLGPACMYKCMTDLDCRTGYKCCDAVAPAGTGIKVCTPAPYLCNQ